MSNRDTPVEDRAVLPRDQRALRRAIVSCIADMPPQHRAVLETMAEDAGGIAPYCIVANALAIAVASWQYARAKHDMADLLKAHPLFIKPEGEGEIFFQEPVPITVGPTTHGQHGAGRLP